MMALSGMYKKPFANDKIHLIKKIFNLKTIEDTSIAELLNEFNTISHQFSSAKIEFNDKI